MIAAKSCPVPRRPCSGPAAQGSSIMDELAAAAAVAAMSIDDEVAAERQAQEEDRGEEAAQGLA